MSDLIERLERATGPDREMDTEIGRLVGLEIHDTGHQRVPSAMEAFYQEIIGVPRYTESLDAAMTLVPEGMCIELDTFPRSKADKRPMAFVAKPLDNRAGWTDGATPPLALCIAALKARDIP